MDGRPSWTRRRVLRASGLGASGLLAGCGGFDEEEPTDPADSATREPQSESESDTAPVIVQFETVPVGRAGRVETRLLGRDDRGVRSARIWTSRDEVRRRPGSGQVSVREQLQAEPGAINTVRAELLDGSGHETVDETDGYARTYDVLENRRLEVGAFYQPWFIEPDLWERCTASAHPRVGRYETGDRRAVARHVDLMEGFGISRLLMWASLPANHRPFVERLDDPLPGSMPIELWYGTQHAMRNRGERSIGEQFDRTTEFYRRNVMERDNYARWDGRPVVTLWNFASPYFTRGEIYTHITESWGGYPGWVEYLRTQFSPGGTEPYLVGMVNNLRALRDEGFRAHVSLLDGVTNWIYRPSETGTQRASWDDVLAYSRTHFELARDVAMDDGLEFFPTVYYGFDNRENPCWGETNWIPRAPDHLRDMLALAERTRTADRVNVATFNDWAEGHAIEPGSFGGEAHDTEYLEIIREFQTE